jgi:serine/threonine protein kinase
VQETLQIGQQLAAALAQLLQQGFTAHRDLQPAFIRLTPEGRVKLMEVGAAKSTAFAPLPSTEAIGTPGYMAPEQINDPETVDIRADIYSVGVVMFELLMGRRPYEGTVNEIFAQHLQKAPPLVVRPDLPAPEVQAANAIIQHCLEKNPANRYQHPNELTQAITAAMQARPSTPEPLPLPAMEQPNSAPPRPIQPEVVRPTKIVGYLHRKPLVWALLAGLFGLFCLAGYALSQAGDAITPTPAVIAQTTLQPVVNTVPPTPIPSPTPGITPSSTATNIPTATPSRTLLPTSTASPTQTPTPPATATTVPTATTPPPSPAPQPRIANLPCGQTNNFGVESTITFRWTWAGTLRNGQYLEVRLGPQGASNALLGSVGRGLQETDTNWYLPVDVALFFDPNTLDYHWEVVQMASNGRSVLTRSTTRGCFHVNPPA